MKFRRLIFFMLASLLGSLVISCAPPIATPAKTAESGLNLIIVADGQVLLKRNSWKEFHPASFGTAVYPGDELQPAANAKVVVLCENLTIWTVPPGSPSGLNNGCPQVAEPSLVRGGSLVANTRGETDPLIPYIISPRATKLLNPTPTLRWNAIPGAKTYTVRISGTDWQQDVSSTQLVYPGNPPLQSGTDYLLIVEADNGKSSKDEGLPGLGFSILSAEEAKRVRAEADSIDTLTISEDAKAYARAQLYASHQLYAEAAEQLEKLVSANTQSTNVYRALGELYQQVNLAGLAQTRYSRALELAKASSDIESVAAAQAKLGEVDLAMGNKTEAINLLTQAQTGYQSLGDSQHAKEIAAQLAGLGK